MPDGDSKWLKLLGFARLATPLKSIDARDGARLPLKLASSAGMPRLKSGNASTLTFGAPWAVPPRSSADHNAGPNATTAKARAKR